uniref:GNAT family N-acetyltransferase n=1 Tax=Veillonella magna TaxID=464322 RepID=UPI00402A8509
MIRRPIEKVDNPVRHHIIQHVLKSYGLDIPGTAYFDPQLGALYEFYEQEEKGQYWVVEEDGHVVGGVGVAPFVGNPSVGELQKLYIMPEAQGKGYSHALMKAAIAFARRHFPALYLETTDILDRANQLYPKYGFTLLESPIEGSEHGAMNRWFLLKF